MAALTRLNCPNCGAPLAVAAGQSLALCVYCASNVRVSYSAQSPPDGATESTLSPEVIAQIKQLLLAGRRAEAAALYQTEAHATAVEAAKAIQTFAAQIVTGIIQAQQLSVLGVVLALLFSTLMVASIVAGLTGALHPALALVLAGAALFLLQPFARAAYTSIKYIGAKSAKAVVVNLAPIGEARGIHTFRILLEVQPGAGAPFRTEMNLPVRERNVGKVRPGTEFQVKYLSGQSDGVIFDRAAKT